MNSIAPHCSDTLLAEIENAILCYYHRKKTREIGQQFGWSQFVLLSGIPESLRSAKAAGRYQELKRKFSCDPVPPIPMKTEVFRVASPIPVDAFSKMNDRHWLAAISRYQDEREQGWIHGQPFGGAIQLSQALTDETKKDPNRFAALALRLPATTNTCYFEAVLRGLTDTQVRIDGMSLYSMIQRCHALPGKPCGRTIAWAVRKHKDDLPSDIVDIISWYAVNDPDPALGHRSIWPVDPGDARSHLLDEGLNSTRGAAADAIATLISSQPQYIGRLESSLRSLVQDPSIAVRAWAAECLVALLQPNRRLSIELFFTLVDADDELLSSRFVETFLNHALRTHLSILKPIVERMANSDNDQTREAGARRACLAALDSTDAQPIADSCLSGDEALRFGAAQVLAANLGDARFRNYCESKIESLFSDESERVRNEAASSFRRLSGDDVSKFADLAVKFTNSPAFIDNCDDMISALVHSTTSLQDLNVDVCEHYMDLFGAASGDISTKAAAPAGQVAELTLRVYSQAKDPVLIGRCLDLVDRMTLSATYGLSGAVESFER